MRSSAALNKTIVLFMMLTLAACTYAPPKTQYHIEAAARKPDSYKAVMMVYEKTSRQATGISAFPNGGIPKLLSSHLHFYLIDVELKSIKKLVTMPVPKNHSYAFSGDFLGWSDRDIYMQLNGCPKNMDNECHGDLRQRTIYRLSESGGIQTSEFKSDTEFKGQSYAPMQEEKHYARLSVDRNSFSAITTAGTEQEVLFRLNKDSGEIIKP